MEDAMRLLGLGRPTKPCTTCGGAAESCCSACGKANYCSAACQHRDWSSHRCRCEAVGGRFRDDVVTSLADAVVRAGKRVGGDDDDVTHVELGGVGRVEGAAYRFAVRTPGQPGRWSRFVAAVYANLADPEQRDCEVFLDSSPV